VLVADSQRLFAESVGVALRGTGSYDVVKNHPTSGDATLTAILTERPDVSLIDFWLSGMDAAAVTRAVLARLPRQKILVLSWLHGPGQIQAAMESGAVGFLPKSLPLGQVIDAINRAHTGESPVFGRELGRLVTALEDRGDRAAEMSGRLSTLTTRELEILRLLNDGRTLKEIAQNLEIAVGTVKNHVHKILTKTGSRSQAEALAVARKLKVIVDTQLPPHPPHSGPHWVG
jgi:DNA-binding NarL/FixJ family response regulator